MANSLCDCGFSCLRVIALCLRHCGKADLSAYAFSVLICLYLRADLKVKIDNFQYTMFIVFEVLNTQFNAFYALLISFCKLCIQNHVHQSCTSFWLGLYHNRCKITSYWHLPQSQLVLHTQWCVFNWFLFHLSITTPSSYPRTPNYRY